MATKWDSQLEQALAARGTVTFTCLEGEKDEIAAAAEAVGARQGLRPQLDRAPANGMRVGFRQERGPDGAPVS
ncbi:hypothetical protein J8J14_10310 [Roseomonas sp. SSH11]|uniref:Uncharacterized protein n=1 Tax=Pararoseomonas baculiformis TaxID=2820812 RepID=A0ABS4ADT2_9PROT|nr:hypothetical protein [Pararoseomonas baculiformis]MBP0445172.1 hypothetical protein [Pararoseomonas baculiformis]